MTAKQLKQAAQEDVQQTLKLIEQYDFAQVDLVEGRSRVRFYYLQSNEQIGVLISYHAGLKLNGEPKAHFDKHCFDVRVVYANNMEEAIDIFEANDLNRQLRFWLPSFRASKPNYPQILDSLCHETETSREALEAKYQAMK